MDSLFPEIIVNITRFLRDDRDKVRVTFTNKYMLSMQRLIELDDLFYTPKLKFKTKSLIINNMDSIENYDENINNFHNMNFLLNCRNIILNRWNI